MIAAGKGGTLVRLKAGELPAHQLAGAGLVVLLEIAAQLSLEIEGQILNKALLLLLTVVEQAAGSVQKAVPQHGIGLLIRLVQRLHLLLAVADADPPIPAALLEGVAQTAERPIRDRMAVVDYHPFAAGKHHDPVLEAGLVPEELPEKLLQLRALQIMAGGRKKHRNLIGGKHVRKQALVDVILPNHTGIEPVVDVLGEAVAALEQLLFELLLVAALLQILS